MARKNKSILANQKAMVLFIAIIFASSTLGAVFLQSSGENGGIDIPETQILKEPLTPEQESLLLQNFRVLVYAQASENSFLFDELEMLMMSFPEVQVEDGSTNFVFLIEEISGTENIRIKTIGNETEFDSYDETEVVAFICDNSHPYVASTYMICAINDM